MMLMTPTRRVNADSVKRSVFQGKNIIEDSVAFLIELRDRYPSCRENILIGGLLGCKGDAYDAESLGIESMYKPGQGRLWLYDQRNTKT